MMALPTARADLATVLDRPIWTALTTRHARFAHRLGAARRFPASVSPFAATQDETEESLAALARLIGDGDDAVSLLQVAPIAVPGSLQRSLTSHGVQMLAGRSFEPERAPVCVRLSAEDAPEMLALTELTRPGPFCPRTHRLGAYWGVKRHGQLIAMAGERLKQPGFTEISAVCVHPDHRGQGYAASLTKHVAAQIQARGETPYLHTFADNEAAIRLYRKLGFYLRREVEIGTLERDRAKEPDAMAGDHLPRPP